MPTGGKGAAGPSPLLMPQFGGGLGSSRYDPNGAREGDALRPFMPTEKCFERCPHLFSLVL